MAASSCISKEYRGVLMVSALDPGRAIRAQSELLLCVFWPQCFSSARCLKELRHDILGHSFEGLNCGLSAEKPKNNGLLRKKTPKG